MNVKKQKMVLAILDQLINVQEFVSFFVNFIYIYINIVPRNIRKFVDFLRVSKIYFSFKNENKPKSKFHFLLLLRVPKNDSTSTTDNITNLASLKIGPN